MDQSRRFVIPGQNRLLSALSRDLQIQLLPRMEKVTLTVSQVLFEAGTPINHVYFPLSGATSLIMALRSGETVEIGTVGNEGVVGLALFMGGETTPSRALVQSPGYAFRLKGSLLKREFERAGALQYLLLRYTQALITQMAQTAVCNRHHGLEQQLCRWLLLSLDRLCSNELTLTEELIANMLGVGHEGVIEAAGKLQAAGLIHYGRGKITVRDRAQLEARVCECYGVVKGESERVLGAMVEAVS